MAATSRHAFRRAMAPTTALVSSLLAGVLWVAPAGADTLETFTALLNGAQENPPVASPSQGVAVMFLSKANLELCYRISYSPLAGTEFLAHFHGSVSDPTAGAPGQNAPILKDISPSPPGPSPLGSPKDGCVTLSKAEAKLFRKGLVYINVHTMGSPPAATSGEIRGQVLPVKGVKYKVP